MSLERSRIKSIIESLIFVSSEPLPFAKIKALLEGVPTNDLKSVLGELQADCLAFDRGVYLEEVAMGYQFRTNPENTDWIMALVETKPRRFSKASLETIAIIAYNQPITRPEIENIRGVDSSSAVNLLLERKIVKIVGRKDVPGKPFLFGTTKEFLELFNLKELSSLPTLQEIENLEEKHPELFEGGESQSSESGSGDEATASNESQTTTASGAETNSEDNTSEKEDNPADGSGQKSDDAVLQEVKVATPETDTDDSALPADENEAVPGDKDETENA
jgi:segregation and condensation protein B